MTIHDKSPGKDPSRVDQILDLLLDALAERQEARKAQSGSGSTAESRSSGPPSPAQGRPAAPPVPTAGPPAPSAPPPRPEPPAAEVRRGEPTRPAARPTPPPPKPKPLGRETASKPPARLPSINLGKTVGRLLILVAVLIVLVNIPVNRYGVSLARVLPDSASLIVRDGLVLKGSGPKIYRLEEGRLRWISSLDAFEHLGLTWADVQVVDDPFLETFEEGQPIHVLLKCETSPHVYRLENQEKRWIKDLTTFKAEGHVWEDVRTVSCKYLQELPDGPPIPEDAGPPPEP